jgi:hypothetical protein
MTLRLQWLMRCLLLVGSAKGESLMLRLLSSMRQWIRSVSSVIVGYMGMSRSYVIAVIKAGTCIVCHHRLREFLRGNWYCSECMNSDSDCFGFVHRRKTCLLETLRRFDNRVRTTSRLQVEKQFWEIVDGKAGELEVMYGSDLDTSIYGSGFPHLTDSAPSSVDLATRQKYCSSPWSLNNFPNLPGSVVRTVQDKIAGVMPPWLYIVMLFSSFCWHVEDHCFYSVNYLHWYAHPPLPWTSVLQIVKH